MDTKANFPTAIAKYGANDIDCGRSEGGVWIIIIVVLDVVFLFDILVLFYNGAIASWDKELYERAE